MTRCAVGPHARRGPRTERPDTVPIGGRESEPPRRVHLLGDALTRMEARSNRMSSYEGVGRQPFFAGLRTLLQDRSAASIIARAWGVGFM